MNQQKNRKISGMTKDEVQTPGNSAAGDLSCYDFTEEDQRNDKMTKRRVRKYAELFSKSFRSGRKPAKRTVRRRYSMGSKSRSPASLKAKDSPHSNSKISHVLKQLSQRKRKMKKLLSKKDAVMLSLEGVSEPSALEKQAVVGQQEVATPAPDNGISTTSEFFKDNISLCEDGSSSELSVDDMNDGCPSETTNEVVIDVEELLWEENTAIQVVRLIFSAEFVQLEVVNEDALDGGKSQIVQWPVGSIYCINSYPMEEGRYIALELGLTMDGSYARDAISTNESGSKFVLKIDFLHWAENHKRIMALCDEYVNLYKHLNGEEMECASFEKLSICSPSSEKRLLKWIDIVYPKKDPDAVTITENDIILLKPMEFLSDTIIDFYIKHLQTALLEDNKNRFYFFNSFFFRKLTEANGSNIDPTQKWKVAFHGVKRWTAKVNIFAKDYLFVPIMQSSHWSLVVVCYPNFNKTSGNIEAEHPCSSCILHLDSLEGSHTGVEEPIKNYLLEAWLQRFGSEDTNDSASEWFLNLPFSSVKVPQQTNYFDCGLFLLHYVELFVKQVDEFPTFLTTNWFEPDEASSKRYAILNLVHRLYAEEIGEDESIFQHSTFYLPRIESQQAYLRERAFVEEKISSKEALLASSSYQLPSYPDGFTALLADVDQSLGLRTTNGDLTFDAIADDSAHHQCFQLKPLTLKENFDSATSASFPPMYRNDNFNTMLGQSYAVPPMLKDDCNEADFQELRIPRHYIETASQDLGSYERSLLSRVPVCGRDDHCPAFCVTSSSFYCVREVKSSTPGPFTPPLITGNAITLPREVPLITGINDDDHCLMGMNLVESSRELSRGDNNHQLPFSVLPFSALQKCTNQSLLTVPEEDGTREYNDIASNQESLLAKGNIEPSKDLKESWEQILVSVAKGNDNTEEKADIEEPFTPSVKPSSFPEEEVDNVNIGRHCTDSIVAIESIKSSNITITSDEDGQQAVRRLNVEKLLEMAAKDRKNRQAKKMGDLGNSSNSPSIPEEAVHRPLTRSATKKLEESKRSSFVDYRSKLRRPTLE